MKIKIIVCLFFIGTFAYGNNEDKNLCHNVAWGQYKNNDYGCEPSYNMYTPDNYHDKDLCGHMLVGCGAVAMGQILYRWKYPSKVNLETHSSVYNWDKISPVLHEGDSDDIPRLLADIGEAVSMRYQNFFSIYITGSWTTTSGILDGFDLYNYSAEAYDEDDWKAYGSAWDDLIKSELASGRPVIMFGMENSEVDLSNSHYFVIDGEDHGLYHINFGWRGYKNELYTLKESGYPYANKLIASISPRTGNEKITCKQLNKTITPNCNRYGNEALKFSVAGANSYECYVYNRDGKEIWRSAGVVQGDEVKVWVGRSLVKMKTEDYWFDVVFKNNSGVRKSISGHVTYSPSSLVTNITAKQLNNKVSPNCVGGKYEYLSFEVEGAERWECSVFDRYGKEVWNDNGYVKDGIANVWGGESRTPLARDTYRCTVAFADECGGVKEILASVDFSHVRCNEGEMTKIDVVNSDKEFTDGASEIEFPMDIYMLNGKLLYSVETKEDMEWVENGLYTKLSHLL